MGKKSTSSSSITSYSSDECIQKGECYHRVKCQKDDICPRSVKTYSVDTCLFSYKPRLLVVPSKRYPNIDCAIRSLSERKGGYVIRLKPGTHNVTTDICGTVDRLEILGDCCPFVGMAYINGCGLRNILLPELCSNGCSPCGSSTGLPPILGRGPFTITFSGRRINIQGPDNPDFSALPKGQLVGVVHRDGTVTVSEVVCGNGNMITFTSDIGVSSIINRASGVEQGFIGEGIFFLPNTVLTGGANWQLSEKLTIRGVYFQGGQWVFGTHGLYVDVGHCASAVGSLIYIIGIYRWPRPNTFLDEVVVDPASMGVTYFQTFAGADARLTIDCAGSNAWRAAIFTSCRGGARVINGGRCDFDSSAWVNCCLGLAAIAGGHASAHHTEFCGNRFACFALYDSTITSYPVEELEAATSPPAFRANRFATAAQWNSFIILEQATLLQNTWVAILDGKTFRQAEALPLGHYGTLYSLIQLTGNPFAVEEADTGCLAGLNTPNTQGTYLSIGGLQGAADFSLNRADTQVTTPATAPANDRSGKINTANTVAGIDLTAAGVGYSVFPSVAALQASSGTGPTNAVGTVTTNAGITTSIV